MHACRFGGVKVFAPAFNTDAKSKMVCHRTLNAAGPLYTIIMSYFKGKSLRKNGAGWNRYISYNSDNLQVMLDACVMSSVSDKTNLPLEQALR